MATKKQKSQTKAMNLSSEDRDKLKQLEGSVEGEELKGMFCNVATKIEGLDEEFIEGTIYISNFQLTFLPYQHDDIDTNVHRIPLASVSRVKVKKKKEQIEVFCKHSRHLSIAFSSPLDKEECARFISLYAFPLSCFQLFAFIYNSFSSDLLQAPHFTLEQDYDRLRLSSNEHLQILDNSKFDYCSTYPTKLILPATMGEEDIREVCHFRSRSRIPSIVWQHLDNGAFLIRCSQPCVGVKGNHCAADERLMDVLRNTQQKCIVILDSRPKANAFANKLRGGGYELAKHYKNMELVFNNIENIHVMRNSLKALQQYCLRLPLDTDGITISEHDIPFEIEECGWFTHLRLVLESVRHAVDLLHNKACSVVVHCSDGWDRTAQTISTAELLLDPFYRTIEGFLFLIEKEWIHFGHQFALRYGHNEGDMDNYKESQRSPIFPQWMDILYQLMIIFPTSFEFGETLLLRLLEELYACRYGNFLFNCQHQREKAHLFERTKSLWPSILSQRDYYANPNYLYDPSILLLDLANVKLSLWANYYVIFQRKGAIIPPTLNHDDVELSSKMKVMEDQASPYRTATTPGGETPPIPKKKGLRASVPSLLSPVAKKRRKKGSRRNSRAKPPSASKRSSLSKEIKGDADTLMETTISDHVPTSDKECKSGFPAQIVHNGTNKAKPALSIYSDDEFAVEEDPGNSSSHRDKSTLIESSEHLVGPPVPPRIKKAKIFENVINANSDEDTLLETVSESTSVTNHPAAPRVLPEHLVEDMDEGENTEDPEVRDSEILDCLLSLTPTSVPDLPSEEELPPPIPEKDPATLKKLEEFRQAMQD